MNMTAAKFAAARGWKAVEKSGEKTDGAALTLDMVGSCKIRCAWNDGERMRYAIFSPEELEIKRTVDCSDLIEEGLKAVGAVGLKRGPCSCNLGYLFACYREPGMKEEYFDIGSCEARFE